MSFSDPIKKQFIDALGEWGLAFARKMDSALAQKRDAFSSTPSLQTLRIGTSKPPTQKSSIPAD
jgi:hypothetical protein